MKVPGPDHPITIERSDDKPVTVRFNGRMVAETRHPLIMREAKYPPVLYIPRSDVAGDVLQRTSHRSHFPYKGDASYFSVVVNGTAAENAAWSYEDPYPAMQAIKEYIAFYPNKVEINEGE